MTDPMNPNRPLPKSSYQRIVGEAVSKAILRSEGVLDARTSIEYIDIVQAIANTGFLRSAIDKGLQHRDPKVRDLIGQFLLDLGLTNIAPTRPAPVSGTEPFRPQAPPVPEPRAIPAAAPAAPKSAPAEESRTQTLMAVNPPVAPGGETQFPLEVKNLLRLHGDRHRFSLEAESLGLAGHLKAFGVGLLGFIVISVIAAAVIVSLGNRRPSPVPGLLALAGGIAAWVLMGRFLKRRAAARLSSAEDRLASAVKDLEQAFPRQTSEFGGPAAFLDRSRTVDISVLLDQRLSGAPAGPAAAAAQPVARTEPVISAASGGRRTIDSLTVADFGLTDTAKFEEWQTAVLKAKKNGNIMGIVAVVAIVLIVLSTGVLILPGALPIIIGYWLINRKANALAKELGITRQVLKAALKGERPGVSPKLSTPATAPKATSQVIRKCPHCQTEYDVREYTPEATVWKCSACRGELTKEA